jgi:hypothetical protein
MVKPNSLPVKTVSFPCFLGWLGMIGGSFCELKLQTEEFNSTGLPRHKVPPITAILRPNLGILRTTGTAQTQQINWMQYVQHQSFEYFEYWYWWYFLNIGTVVSMVLIFDIDDILILNIIHPPAVYQLKLSQWNPAEVGWPTSTTSGFVSDLAPGAFLLGCHSSLTPSK